MPRGSGAYPRRVRIVEGPTATRPYASPDGTHDDLCPGSPFPGPRGDVRWRLSAATRTLTRVADGAELSDLIGKEAAANVISGFLSIRPGGGRVWSDDAGRASTVVTAQAVYLGLIRTDSGPAAAGSVTRGTLETAVVDVLLASPGSTAREVVYQLSLQGVPTDRRTVNALLYGQRSTFESDGATVPRWRALSLASRPVASRQTPTVQKSRKGGKSKQVSTNAYAALVDTASIPSPKAARSHPVSRRYDKPALALLAWQQEAMQRWYDRGCHGIVEAVTGTGKTHLGLEAAEQARRDGEKVTILVPSVDLQDQWVERFRHFLPHVRLARVGGKKTGDPARADVTVAVVNSAVKQDLAALSPDSLLVADEVHRYGAVEFQYALRAGYGRRLGLTATLERSGDDAVEEILSPYFGGIIMTMGFNRALREGVVAPFRLVLAPVAMVDEERAEYEKISRSLSHAMKQLKAAGAISGGGDVIGQIARLGGAGGSIGRAAWAAQSAMRERRQMLAGLSSKIDAVEELAELIEDSQGAVVFTQSKAAAEQVAAAMRGWKIPASALHSDMGVAERRHSLAALTTGELKLLAAPRLLDEGIDVQAVDLGIVTTASRSQRQMIQRLGRVIRRKDDGRTVTFVLIYAEDTVEDPAEGVHEGFFDMVEDIATDKLVLEPGWTSADIAF
ncbi:DEAD/DEAH box helicase [Nocardioidaceae bacterium]|nr:DEAD/DEAH box helicase [Nocardioidaceae bacterium]